MIQFKTIRWKNFLSTGNIFTELLLDKSPNTLIVGNNGAGKSTILDALCFSLFGKSYRKINKPQLINSINQSDCVVEIEFVIGKKQYKVVRGMKPTIFEIYCNSKLINQDSNSKDYQEYLETNILKMNYKSFTQVVILGSASFIPFMQLTPADRRSIIEELLDIQIFSSMNSTVKEKLSSIKEDYSNNKYEMDLLSEKIILQKQNIEEHKKQNDDEILKIKDEISKNESEILETQSKIDLIQKHIVEMQKSIEPKVSLEAKSKKFSVVEAQVESNIKTIEKEIKFYDTNDSCPTCKQELENKFKSSQIIEKTKKKEELNSSLLKIVEQMEKLNTKIKEMESINKKITQHNNEIIKYNSTITNINLYIGKLNKQMEEKTNRKNSIEEDNLKLKEMRNSLSELVKNQEKLAVDKQYYEYSATMLKDNGIKTKIIKQYLPVMNKLINKYLTSMDFFVNFNINENFEESIKSRHRDVFSYSNFSEGEKLRIDLALLFTWRQVAKLKNSTNTNLLIMDEVFDSSLDTVGTEEFLKLIKEIGKDTNVFVISHKGDQLFDKFRSVIKFNKKNNFSQVEK